MRLRGKLNCENGEMVSFKCIKTKPPKMNLDRNAWDWNNVTIDGIEYKFYYRSTGNFFFYYHGGWYKVGYNGTGGRVIGINSFPKDLYVE